MLDKIVLCFVTRSLSATTQKNRLDRAGEKGVKAWNGPKIHQFAENFALNAIFFRNKPVLFYLHNFLSRESERKLIFENRINDFMKITSELNWTWGSKMACVYGKKKHFKRGRLLLCCEQFFGNFSFQFHSSTSIYWIYSFLIPIILSKYTWIEPKSPPKTIISVDMKYMTDLLIFHSVDLPHFWLHNNWFYIFISIVCVCVMIWK